MQRMRPRNDRGEMITAMYVAFLVPLIVTGVFLGIVAERRGRLSLLLEFAAGLSLVVLASLWLHRKWLRRVEWRDGALLREWLDVERLERDDLRCWVMCCRRGVTVEQARRWSDDGLPYPLILLSRGGTADRAAVRELAGVMAAAGAWDGRDRRHLIDLIGKHYEIANGGYDYPVLARWLALPHQEVRSRVAQAVAAAAVDPEHLRRRELLERAGFKARGAAEDVLYDLEHEHSFKQGYDRPGRRQVHPSWWFPISG